MKYTYCIVIFSFLALGAGGAKAAATPEQAEIIAFIEKMYSYDPETFDGGEFDKKGMPFKMNKAPEEGRVYMPDKHCQLLSLFLDGEIIKKSPSKNACSISSIRFPAADIEELSVDLLTQLQHPNIAMPVIEGENAKVQVFPRGYSPSRSLFFLVRTDRGWRVRNVMMHTKWPDPDKHGNRCYFNFAIPPSAEERKDVPAHCR